MLHGINHLTECFVGMNDKNRRKRSKLMDDVLIIGNGFDLAHELPTSYRHFLYFVSEVRKEILGIDTDYKFDDKTRVEAVISQIKRNSRSNLFQNETVWKELIGDNCWVDYFLSREKDIGTGWIDFENEIQDVLESIKHIVREKESGKKTPDISDLWHRVEISDCIYSKQRATFSSGGQIGSKKWCENVLRILENDLSNIEGAIERYLGEVERIDFDDVELSDIKEILDNRDESDSIKVFSFNYTNTVIKRYNMDSDDVMFVHGRIRRDFNADKCNIVLGVDELVDIPEGLEGAFIPFQKFYRREAKQISHSALGIIKDYEEKATVYDRTMEYIKDDISVFEAVEKIAKGSDSSKRIDEMIMARQKEFHDSHPKSRVYVFGHSLAKSDREYFTRFFLNDYVVTTVFYRDDYDRGRLMKSLLIMIGNDEFKKRMELDDIVFKKMNL